MTGGPRRHVLVTLHSNAIKGKNLKTRGALGIHNLNSNPNPDQFVTPHQVELAGLLGEQVNVDLLALTLDQNATHSEFFPGPWVERNGHAAGPEGDRKDEIKAALISREIDGAILEAAFHDNSADTRLLSDPKAREAVGRSVGRAIVDYFHQFGVLAGSPRPVDAPERPYALAAISDVIGTVALSWQAPPVGAPSGGGAVEEYVVYRSSDGAGFRPVAKTSDTRLDIVTTGGGRSFFRVSAINAGGESMPSATTSTTAGVAFRLLLVEGRGQPRRELGPMQRVPRKKEQPRGSDETPVYRIDARASHAAAGLVPVARALDRPFDSVHADRFSEVDLSVYAAIVWLAGRHAAADLLSDDDVSRLRGFHQGGGRLVFSGARAARVLSEGSEATRGLLAEVFGVSFRETIIGQARLDAGSELFDLRFRPGVSEDDGRDPGETLWLRDGLSARAGFDALVEEGPWTENLAAVAGERTAFFAFPLEAMESVAPLDQEWTEQRLLSESLMMRRRLLSRWL